MSTLRQTNKSLYWAWKAMKQRCLNPRCRAFKNYGARGITVCSEWMNFEPFCEWAIKNGYEQGLDLDRANNNAGYSPDNCRWITRKENTNNRRCTTLLTVDGVTKARTEWESALNIPRGIIKAWVITHGKEYAQARIQEVMLQGYVERDYSYGHGKAVRCVNTGEVFRSIREASRAVGVSPISIMNALKAGGKTSKGRYTWEEIS